MAGLKNSQGSALLVVLALILLASVAAMISFDAASTEIELSYNQIHEDQAFYVAESGAIKAFSAVNVDSSWRAGFENEPFSEGIFTVTLRDSVDDPALADTVIVLSTAEVDGCRSTVELTLIPDIIYPFSYALFADSAIDIKNSFVTDSYNSDSGKYATTYLNEGGDVGSNGTISVNLGASIGGDVATSLTGGAQVQSGATVTGTVTDAAPEVELPRISDEEFTWAESVNAAKTGLSGNCTYKSGTNELQATGPFTLKSGVYFFSSITLWNSASLHLAPGAEVTIYVTGNIEVKNSGEINPGGDAGDLMIYSRGDLILKNSGNISCVFYNPDGTADLRNTGELYGSIVAGDIVAHNSAEFHYDRSLATIKRKGIDNYDMVAWREVL
ncbi:MAG: hypothetical protein AB1772_07470 [Candidatus Zixiibacteriota bacterium]